MLAEMAQDECRDRAVEIRPDESRDNLVRKVSPAAHDPLLNRPWITAVLEHVQVVVRFQQYHIGTSQVHFNGIGHVTEVRYDSNTNSLRTECVTDRIDRIMRNGEAFYLEVTHGEAAAGLEKFEPHLELPVDACRRRIGEIDRNIEFSNDGGETANMITVLVRNQDCIEILDPLSDRCQASGYFTAAQSSINKHTSSASRNVSGIARTAAR